MSICFNLKRIKRAAGSGLTFFLHLGHELNVKKSSLTPLLTPLCINFEGHREKSLCDANTVKRIQGTIKTYVYLGNSDPVVTASI